MVNSSNSSPAESQPIDKEKVYGYFLQTQKWQDNLSRKLAHQAVDIPDDDMDININKSGLGWKELAVIGAMALGAFYICTNQPPATPPVAPTAVHQETADRDTTRRITVERYNPSDD